MVFGRLKKALGGKEAESGTFDYLKNMISEGEKTVILDSDITLKDGISDNVKFMFGIALDVDGLVIDGGGHSIDAKGKTRIFNVVAKDITIKNLTIKNGYFPKGHGGAVYIDTGCSLTLIDVEFENNRAEAEGGAISNFGLLEMKDCRFDGNRAKDNGGSIYNHTDCVLNIEHTTFTNNRSERNGGCIVNFGKCTLDNPYFRNNESGADGGAIFNNSNGTLTVSQGGFHRNGSGADSGAICNFGKLEISHVQFKDNTSTERGGAIYTNANSTSIITSCMFYENASGSHGGAIHNFGKLTLSESDFKENTSPKEGGAINNQESGSISGENVEFGKNSAGNVGGAIVNWGYISLNNIKFNENTAKSGLDIYNLKDFKITDSQFALSKSDAAFEESPVIFENCSFADDGEEAQSSGNNFRHLFELIAGGLKEIMLDEDIVLEDGEEISYPEGISLEADAVTIDGAGHTIDARGKTRIFKTYGKGLTIKNITLKNGRTDDYGGAIYCKEGDLNLINVTFLNNEGVEGAGAIMNMSEITVSDCTFEANTSQYGSAIFSIGDLTVMSTDIKENSSGYGTILNQGNIEIRDSRLTSNTASISGGSIYNKGNAAISTSDIKGNRSKDFGCAIVNENIMKITDCSISENGMLNSGNVLGSIFNSGKLTLKSVEMQKNDVEHGSCIFNNGEAFVSDSILKANTTFKGMLYNRSFMRLFNTEIEENEGPVIFNSHHLQIVDGKICKNKSETNMINNVETTDIFKTAICENESEDLILNEEHGKVNLSEGEIANNVCKTVIANKGRSINISKTSFENPSSPDKIKNSAYLYLDDPKLDDERTICNDGEIFIKKLKDEYLEKIYGDGEIIKGDVLSGRNNFTVLDEMIHESVSNEIELESDIVLDHNEADFFEGGIIIDCDDMTIDGKGHTIDANGLSRIFTVVAENITLKNITFKNGFNIKNYSNGANNFGGALKVSNISSLKLENCAFEDNTCEVHGGAIDNGGKLEISDSRFERNSVEEGYGGAISNRGEITIHNNNLSENTASKLGGAILNHKMGKMTIKNSQFTKNSLIDFSGESYGGAISNDGELSIVDSEMNSNCSKKCGGAISNDFNGNLSINNVTFSKNMAKLDSGGAIYNEGKITIENSAFNENTSKNAGGVIYNNSRASIKEVMKKRTLNRKEASLGLVGIVFNKRSTSMQSTDFYEDVGNDEKSGTSEISIKSAKIANNSSPIGAGLWNGDYMTVKDTTIEANTAKTNGGAISNVNAEMIIENCEILKNTAGNNGAAIFNYGDSTVTVKNSNIKSNSSKNSKSISDENNAHTTVIDCEIDDM